MADGDEPYEEMDLRQEAGEEESECLTPASFLPQLNLTILVLSMLSSSREEGLDLERVNPPKNSHEQEANNNAHMTRLHTRRQGMHDFKFMGDRRASRMQSSVRDIRHCRKM
uniref:Uncharacterized protein n=1 Tax=Kalanchoe fedtschenkoi TaxID=63787 RepID=A0A7N0UC68_KALFE